MTLFEKLSHYTAPFKLCKNISGVLIMEMNTDKITDMRNNSRMHYSHRISILLRRLGFRGSVALSFFIGKMLTPKINGGVVIKCLYGYDILVFNNNNDVSPIYLSGTCEPGTLHIMRKVLSRGDIFFDIGANIGMMSLYAWKLVSPSGEVHAFEPEFYNYSALKFNINMNGASEIHLNNFACGSEKTHAILYPNFRNLGNSSIIKPDDSSRGEEIRVERLDDYIRMKSIPKIKMLKIDVEGYELEVLRGATSLLESDEAPVICCEYCGNRQLAGGNPIDLYRFIKDVNNYDIYILKRGDNKVSKLVNVTEKDIPRSGIVNLHCFLPIHYKTIDNGIFA
jgi:FkbM family methyltransferase